jgi:hypothetical protein
MAVLYLYFSLVWRVDRRGIGNLLDYHFYEIHIKI